MTDRSVFDDLIAESAELDSRAAKVQGERKLRVDGEVIEQLVNDYQDWFARAIADLPEELHARFRDLYEGGMVIKRIKSFLEAPGRRSQLWDPEQPDLMPYW